MERITQEAYHRQRMMKYGESMLSILDPKDMYDIVVDTFNNTKEECADKIIEEMEDINKYTSFKTLWSQHNE